MDGPFDGDDDEKKQDPKKPGKLIVLAGGKKVDPKEVGAGYVVGQTGNVPTSDIASPIEVDKELRERQTYVKNQEIVQTIGRHGTTNEIIDLIMLEIAEELSHLKFERRRAAKEGKPTMGHTINRAQGLRSLAEILLKRREASRADRLDSKSPFFQAVFKVWINFFIESMEKSGIESHIIDLVMQQMKSDMVDWEKKMDTASTD